MIQSETKSENSHQKRLQGVIEKRWDRLKLCNDSVELQAIALEHCRHNIYDWIEDWVWTYDPRVKPSMVPLLLFPKQREYLAWRTDRRSHKENGLTEKSRDMGITWMNVCHQVHCWLFEDGYKGAFGSRKEMLVDRIGDPDSIFEKIRILLRYLPRWMLPQDFSWKQHDNFCKLINPANGSTITGEAGDDIGRGGRSALYDVDEFAFVEHPHSVDAALSNNTDVVFYTSSANGIGNLFYKKRMTYPASCVFRMHWRDDPRKDDQWYATQKQKYDAVTVASEIDIDYGASVEGIYIPNLWVLAAIALELPKRGPLMAGLDVAISGGNLNVLTIRQGPTVLQVISWDGTNTTETAFKVREILEGMGVKHLNIDADGVGAGVIGTLAQTPGLKFSFSALHGSGSPSDREWVGEDKTSKEKFYNARAENWGLLRERFRKTYDHVNQIRSYPLDELISIPEEPKLIAQISQPKRKFTSAGKILIEGKEEMRSRGLDSPDFADSLVYAMCDGSGQQMGQIVQAAATPTPARQIFAHGKSNPFR